LKLYGNKTSGNAYVKKLEKLVEEKNVKNVLINDFLDEKDLLFEYERSHYLMSASLKEVQSMVYIESLASGKPIIALENEAVSEIVNKKNGLMLSKKTSPLNFAKKTTKFVNYTLKNYKNISSVCRASVFQFEINTVCEALINAYKYAATIKSSKDITTETKFYQMIKDIIPEQILNIMPENFKFSKEREKTATLKIWLQLSSTFSMLLSIIGLIFLKKRTNN
jgi:replicative superfamily II helicase